MPAVLAGAYSIGRSFEKLGEASLGGGSIASKVVSIVKGKR
jgi:hypothetical protein